MSTRISHQPTNHVPEPVTRVADLMSAYRSDWALCGGWAVDAWLGHETRDHGDVDIAVFQDDHRALFEHLDGWDLVAHDAQVDGGTAEPWNGRRLDLPGHIHGRPPEASEALPDRLDAPAQAGFSLDIQIGRRSGRDWIFRREPRVAMPLRRCVRQSGWGLPTLAPEVVLFYKARARRPHDELDFLALLPHLTERQRDWLSDAISRARPGHPWLTQLVLVALLPRLTETQRNWLSDAISRVHPGHPWLSQLSP